MGGKEAETNSKESKRVATMRNFIIVATLSVLKKYKVEKSLRPLLFLERKSRQKELQV